MSQKNFSSRFSKLSLSGKLYLLSSFLDAQQYIWPVTVAFITLHYGLASVGVWLFTLGISQIISEVPTGYIADRFGYKVSIGIGGLFNFVGMIVLALIVADPVPIVSGLFLGLGSALKSGATDALVYESMSHDEYEEVLLWQVTAFQVGLISSVALGGYLYTVKPELPFIVQSVTSLLVVVPYMFITGHAGTKKAEKELTGLFKAVRHILSNAKLRSLLFVTSVYFAVIDSWLEILTESKLIEIGLAPDQRGLFISGIKVFNLLLFNYVLFKFAKTKVSRMRFAQFSIIIFWPLAVLVNSFPLFTFIYIGISVAPFARRLIVDPIIQKAITGKLRATELSIFSLSAILISSAFFLTIGFVVERFGTNWVFLSLATITAVYTYPVLMRHVRED